MNSLLLLLPITILTFYSCYIVLPPLDSRPVKERGVGVLILQLFDSGSLLPVALFFSPEVIQLGFDPSISAVIKPYNPHYKLRILKFYLLQVSHNITQQLQWPTKSHFSVATFCHQFFFYKESSWQSLD